MNANELREKFWSLYEYMANSKKPENMKAFGRVMTTMMEDLIQSNPSKAEEYISRLESVKWDNYLTPSEANKVVSAMVPNAPWTKDQWKAAMERDGYALDEWPHYNKYALWTVMNMIMSDSSATLAKFVDNANLFKFVHDLAVDKLKDADEKFNVRAYFDV